MRFRFISGLVISLLVLAACGSESDVSDGGESDAGGAGGTGDAGTGGVGGGEAGTGGSTGGRPGVDGGGTSGSAGSTGATGGTGGDAGVPSCTLSDSWQTIDDFQLAAGEHSNPAAIAAAPPNRLYAVGVARMGTFQWHVRRSNDGGGTWEAVDEGATGGAADVVVDSMGTVYVAGSTDAGRIVRRSTNNGDTWMTVDTIPGGSGTDPCSAGALARTANDTIYFAAGCDSTGVVVRRSMNGGDTWTDVDSFQYTTTAQTRMGTLGADSSGQAYVGGTGGQPLDGSNHWLVRRGTGAGTWTTVDDYQLAAANHASVANFFGSADAIYAAGSANDADGASHWIIRRASVDDPSAFTTVDDVGPTQNLEQLAAHNVYQASSGLFVAAGSSRVGTASGRVVYRRSTDGETWSSAGEFQYVTAADSAPSGRIAEDAAGNLYGMVRGVDADGFAHWIVRRLMCN